MSKFEVLSKTAKAPQKPTATGRVFKLSLKGIPAVDSRAWAEIKAAAKTPRKGRAYAELIEAPDASI